jgi:platelet-activating factor acetylhydrolase IB subunit beta/gamma
MTSHNFLAVLFNLLMPIVADGIAYPYSTAEPQKSGWPLTDEERAYVVDKAEHDRRPGREANKHLPHFWPVVPSAGHFGGDAWLKLHEAHVRTVKANAGLVDVLLVGDSITIQWGDSWTKHFPEWKAVNIGIGGDKTQNVLWRLDHGGVEGLEPKCIVLMIGNNNMFFTPETGIEPVAKGIEMCVKNLREKFPDAKIVVAKILPAHAPDNRFHKDILATNEALDAFKLNGDPQVQVLDLTSDFVNDDGTLKKELYTPDNIHLSPAGYAAYAARLKPMLEAMLAGKPVPAMPAR